MPTYQQTTIARERVARFKETHLAFKRESICKEESRRDIRRALQSTSASEFILAEVL